MSAKDVFLHVKVHASVRGSVAAESTCLPTCLTYHAFNLHV